jgi:hypothetical protein
MTVYIHKSPESVDEEPVRVQVTRWRCPFCGRSHSGRSRARAHIARCWLNPGARSCKTCLNYEPESGNCGEYSCNGCGSAEFCHAGVEIPVPSEDRPDRLVLPLHCPLWKADRS